MKKYCRDCGIGISRKNAYMRNRGTSLDSKCKACRIIAIKRYQSGKTSVESWDRLKKYKFIMYMTRNQFYYESIFKKPATKENIERSSERHCYDY